MKIINIGFFQRVLAPTLSLLFMLMSVRTVHASFTTHKPETAKPRQDAGQLRGTFVRTANRVGRSDGLKAGRQDRKRGEPSNFSDEKNYQNATNGYSRGMGNKEKYRQVYRSAFENGYRDGWNGY